MAPTEQEAGAAKLSAPPLARRRRWPALGTLLLLTAAVSFSLLVALPSAAIFGRLVAIGIPLQALGRPIVVEALRLSLLTTLLTVGLAALLGTPAAYTLARRGFPGRRLLERLIEVAPILPPAVAGIGLALALGPGGAFEPLLGALRIPIGLTTGAVVLAQLVVAAPLYVQAAQAGFQAIDRELEAVARTLGVSGWAVFWRVSVPLAAPWLLRGLAACWARALGEFGATLIFAGSLPGRTQTMPLAAYAALDHDLDAALVLAALLVLLALGVFALPPLLIRRLRYADA